MQSFPTDKIRNVALVGHGGVGKTSLAEAMLHTAGVTNRLGRVDDGHSVTDFEPEEIDKKYSVSAALAPLPWKGVKINLIDTPGFPDFVGEVEASLRAVDLALFVVSAVEGVEIQTEIVWKAAERMGVPRAIFVNKLDRDRADFDVVVEQMVSRFGKGVAPLRLPVGREATFDGVVDALSEQAFTYSGTGGKGTEAPVPEDLKARLEDVHIALTEAVVESDDGLLEAYLEGDMPDPATLRTALGGAVAQLTAFPVLVGSATKNIGVDQLLDFLVEESPAPGAGPAATLTEGVATYDPAGPIAAQVFKTVADPYLGKFSLFRVLSGTIKPDTELEDARSGATVRMHAPFTVRGKEHIPVEAIAAGDIGAVAKLADVRTGDTLRTKGSGIVAAPIEAPSPMLAIAITPKSREDDDKLSTGLARLADEDQSIRVERNTETNETILSGMGEAHIDIALGRLQRKYGVSVTTATPRVPYRETIMGRAEAEGKHKKQTGGKGQFGVAYIRVEPTTRGEGFSFIDKIVGGAIPRGFLPAIEKGVRQAMSRGILAGYPVVDIQATCYDGKHHAVDSDEMSFVMAGSIGFQAAARQARPVLLEPIVTLEVTVPDSMTGDVMGDINAKRGRVLGMDPGDGETVIHAHAPLAECQRYAIDLRSITQGRGRFTMHLDRYEEMPAHLAESVIAAAKKDD